MAGTVSELQEGTQAAAAAQEGSSDILFRCRTSTWPLDLLHLKSFTLLSKFYLTKEALFWKASLSSDHPGV